MVTPPGAKLLTFWSVVPFLKSVCVYTRTYIHTHTYMEYMNIVCTIMNVLLRKLPFQTFY